MTRVCEMGDCDSNDDVRAARDPSDNVVELCAKCRRLWPVTLVEGEIA